MRDDVAFELYVKQPAEISLQQMVDASKQFGITDDEINRAILNWIVKRIQDGPVPEWLNNELIRLRAEAPVVREEE